MSTVYQRVLAAYDRFLFESTDPRMCSMLRIGYACLLLVFLSLWFLDAELWFTDSGVLRADTARHMDRGSYGSLFFWLPATNTVIYGCLGLLLIQSMLLLLGCWSRFQIACIYVWLTSFQHRNPLIVDGEDTVFRLIAFFMILMPLDYAWSLTGRRRSGAEARRPASAWALRLVQIEITAIYMSAAWSKWQGTTWRDGTALYYVARMDDVFGRLWLPEDLFQIGWLVQTATWGALGLETALPLLLWLPKTRRLGIAVGIGFHLMIELTMHLFLFEWIMMLGLLSFLKTSDFTRQPAPSTVSPAEVDANCPAQPLAAAPAAELASTA